MKTPLTTPTRINTIIPVLRVLLVVSETTITFCSLRVSETRTSRVSHLARSFQTFETRLSRGKSKLRGSVGPEMINSYASNGIALRKEENLFQEQFSSFPLIFLSRPLLVTCARTISICVNSQQQRLRILVLAAK